MWLLINILGKKKEKINNNNNNNNKKNTTKKKKMMMIVTTIVGTRKGNKAVAWNIATDEKLWWKSSSRNESKSVSRAREKGNCGKSTD